MVNWTYFWTEKWPNFSIHTATFKDTIFWIKFLSTCTEKVHLQRDVNNLWLISDISSNKCGFCVFLWFLTVTASYFCQFSTVSFSEMEFVHSQFILHPKSIIVLVWCEISVVQWCLFIIQWFSQFWCISKLFSYREL